MDHISSSSEQPSKKLHELSEDRLTNLPDNVIEEILIRLPLRDAVRTSILSSSWRYQWSNISELVFDYDEFPLHRSQPESEIVKIIDQVLLLHRGPIRKFGFSLRLWSSLEIERWVLFLSRNGIKEFILEKWDGQSYKLPSCLFTCKEINYLKLYSCTLIPPTSFSGYSNLTTLHLCCISCSKNNLENLISKCPRLNKLVLKWINGCDHLKLFAPNLVNLYVEGEFKDLCFMNTPNLAEVSLDLSTDEEPITIANGVVCRLVHLLGCLPSIRRLELLGLTYQFMSAIGDVPARIPTAYQLLHLSLTIDFQDTKQMLIALHIIRSSTSLQKLDIMSKSDHNSKEISVDDFWKAQRELHWLFHRLQIIIVSEYSGSASELKFIEFFLATAPDLEMVKIELKEDMSDVTKELKIFRKLIQLRRVSSKAQLVIPELEVLSLSS